MNDIIEEVSESRFFMWRAVVAMAHADKIVEPEEKELIESYLSKIPFSEQQKEILRRDLEKQRDVAQMFELITDPEDQGEFFQFARMLVWSDGDYDAQEKKILEYLEHIQMRSLNRDRLREMVKLSRQDSRLQRLREDEMLAGEASHRLSIGAIFKSFFGF
jgi:uncharacterized membrane protein YebE (DUF533 family)